MSDDFAAHAKPEARRFLRIRLLGWWTRSKRQFPWRETRDPYSILMAEMMLRRTRASQVEAVYRKFIGRFPDTVSLSNSKEEELRQILRPLGLSWRIQDFVDIAHNMQQTSVDNLDNWDSQMIMELPGAGEYIASAVSCFSAGDPVPIIDSNVERILKRYFAIQSRTEMRRRKDFRKLAEKCVDRKRPRDYNWALLDLAALICTSKTPKCYECPLKSKCAGAASGGNDLI